ncbi:GIY-YIG nuclease family protein [Amycolatopsis sp. NPDC051071]|uniref:GIY-YIG nuclease family protein n=1 Tax=Amycolatopsis sp. NPDC051071 TaxID=3154637 RepID=UPI003413D2E7
MAPVKPESQKRRHQAAKAVLELLNSTDLFKPTEHLDPQVADALSEVKGLFTRSCKQDQWDWFTVWTQLGRPGRKRCRDISNELRNLRRAMLDQDAPQALAARHQLIEAGFFSTIQRFLNPRPDGYFGGSATGYVYILSTRSSPRLLKIGYTERTVEQRVKKINSTTGILEPYGVRAVWVVQNAPQVERAVHQALADHRVRADREFFELPYGAAFKIVGDIVHNSRREL